jgi:hypothetical protein
MATKGEEFQWLLTTFNTIHSLFDTLGGIHEKLPEDIKKRVPRWFGLTLDDEQIFNGLVRSLKKKDAGLEESKEPDIEKQKIIFKFLYKRCKPYERNRFINVVAGMEVLEAKPGEEERKWHPTSGQLILEKIKKPIPGSDRRREFLDAFGTVLISYGNLGTAYEECVGGRMIISNPLHQKALSAFSKSVKWFGTEEGLAKAIDSLASQIDPSGQYKIPKPKKSYPGFFRAFFGFKSKQRKEI